MLVVQKYGGSSVANGERILNVARRIAKTAAEGHSVVVVLSAQGDTTDNLLTKARELTRNPKKRELDMLLSTGEQQSVALMAMALNDMRIAAISLTGVQAGIYTSSNYGGARIKDIKTDRILSELDRQNVVVVAGFQGVNRYGDTTTLGRGASDISAVAIAAAIGADICEIYTDVDGVYTADPRIVKNARKLDEISYDEMIELSSLGAKVLANRSVELAKKYQVKLVVRSSFSDDSGTEVKEETSVEKMMVSGVAIDRDVARISVLGLPDRPGIAFKLFSQLSKKKISVDIILQSIGRDGTKDITFTVAKSHLNEVLSILDTNKKILGASRIVHDENVAKVSIVGAGMAANSGVASQMFEALYDANININMISTSEIKISVLIDEHEVEKALISVHDKFSLQNVENVETPSA